MTEKSSFSIIYLIQPLGWSRWLSLGFSNDGYIGRCKKCTDPMCYTECLPTRIKTHWEVFFRKMEERLTRLFCTGKWFLALNLILKLMSHRPQMALRTG